MGKIITSNLDGEFKKSKKGYDPTKDPTIPKAVKENFERIKDGRSVQAVAQTSRVVEPFYQPFIQRTTIEIPKNYKTLNRFKRYFYHNEPLVGAACELHAEFPLSTFEVTHEDKMLRDEFQGLSEDLNLFEFLLDMLLEYWVIGEAFPFGFFDDPDKPQTWKKFILLNPDFMEVTHASLATPGRDTALFMDFDDTIKGIVNDGGKDEKKKIIYDALPPDIIECVKQSKSYFIPSEQCVHFKRGTSYFNLRGVSIIERCLKWLFYRDKLREAQYAIADRHITPKEFYLIGDSQREATPEELNNFYNLLQATWSQPNTAIVWHHALKIQWEGASGRVLPLQPEFQYVDKQLAIALLINEGIVTADKQPYASTSVALDVMIQRYMTVRMRIEKFLKDFVFSTVCRLNKIVKRSTSELKYHIRLNSPDRDLWLPDVRWSKQNLRDDLPKLQFVKQLVDGGLLPKSHLYMGLDLDPEEVEAKLAEEKGKVKSETQEGSADFSAVGAPESPSSEEEEPGDLPELAEGLGEVGEKSRARSPESDKPGNLPTGI